MMRSIIAAALAATLLPVAAQAQSYDDNHDRQEVRHDRRELRDDRRDGDRGAVRDDRRDLRGDRRDVRDDAVDRGRSWGHDDWRGWRETHGDYYGRGNWHAPFRYSLFRPGVRIATFYFGPRYIIADPWRYHLPPVHYGQAWVRHYDDVILVDTRRGIVLDVIRGFYR